MEDEIAQYKIQLQQVEAALLGDPENDELQKLKIDLQEIIALQEDIHAANASEKAAARQNAVPAPNVIHQFVAGERVLAKNHEGKQVSAIIDALTPAGIAITYTGSGQKAIVREQDLQLPPEHQRKNFASDRNKAAAGASSSGQKKEWKEERERKRAKNLKKAEKRKEFENVKETEKKSWQQFNTKAANKGLKGLKRLTATATSKDGSSAYGVKRDGVVISSRSNEFAFKSVRGAMDSLF